MKIKSKNRQEKVLIYCDIMLKILLFLILLFQPVIIRMKNLNFISPKLEPEILMTGNYSRIFDHYNFSFLLIVSAIIFFLFCVKLFYEKINISNYDYYIVALILIAIISTLFSKYMPIAFKGTYSRLDGSLFYILCFFLVFVASKLEYCVKDLKIVFMGIAPFLLVNTAIVILYYKDFNLIETKMFSKIVFGSQSFNINPGSYFISTIENPNYLSGFSGVLAIMFLICFLFENSNKISGMLFYYISFVLSIFLLFSSFSLSGVFSFFATIIFIFPFLKEEEDYMKFLAKILISIITVFFTIYLFFTFDNKTKIELLILKKIIIDNYVLIVILIILSLTIFLVIKNIHFSKKSFLIVNVITPVLLFIILLLFPYSSYYQEEFPNKIYTEDEIRTEIGNKDIYLDQLSGRVFIWQQTMDLIKENKILGYGFGVFPYELRQQSLFNATNSWPPNIIFDKPHNMYLGFAFGGGIMFLALFFLLYFNLLVKTLEKLKLIFSSFDLAIFLGILAFLLQGLVNDPSVSFFPVIMIFTGILISRTCNLHD